MNDAQLRALLEDDTLCGDLTETPAQTIKRLRHQQPEKKVVVEVADMAEALLWAAAGGIRVDNVAAYVRAGADLLVTSSPYWAAPRDVQVHFKRGAA